MGFHAKVSVIESKVLLVEGGWNLKTQGARIRFILRDSDYPDALPASAKWNNQSNVEFNLPDNLTYLQDSLYCKNGKFIQKIDLSRDPGMYALDSKKYILEFYYNPRSAPNAIQDRLGWSGEGMADKHHLNTRIRPKQRVIYATLALEQDQIMRTGKWKSITPILITE
jgi:hypothetical protein